MMVNNIYILYWFIIEYTNIRLIAYLIMSTVHCDCLRAPRSLLHHDNIMSGDGCTRNIVFTIIILQFIRNIFCDLHILYIFT